MRELHWYQVNLPDKKYTCRVEDNIIRGGTIPKKWHGRMFSQLKLTLSFFGGTVEALKDHVDD